MEAGWEPITLQIEPYKETGTSVFRGIDEYMALLDEHSTTTQAMSFVASLHLRHNRRGTRLRCLRVCRDRVSATNFNLPLQLWSLAVGAHFCPYSVACPLGDRVKGPSKKGIDTWNETLNTVTCRRGDGVPADASPGEPQPSTRR